MSSAVKTVKSVAGGGIQEGAEAQAAAIEAGAARARRQSRAAIKGIQRFFPRAQEAITTGTTEARGLLAPGTAQRQLEAFSGAAGQEAQAQAFQQFQESPGQAFLREQAERGTTRNAAAIGGLGGGNVRRELQRQAIGLASQDFGNQFNRLQNVQAIQSGTQANLANLATGQGTQLANLLTGQGTALANIRTGQSQQALDVGSQLGQAAAQRELGRSATATGLLNIGSQLTGGGKPTGEGGGTGGLDPSTLAQFASLASDKNLKTDIKDLSPKECYEAVIDLPLKSWRYLKEVGIDEDVHFGPMAQDAPEFIKEPGKEALKLHDELMLIAGAIQYMGAS